MGYLFLFLALIAGATKGHCGKKTSNIVTTLPNVSLMTCIRMLLCIVIGFFFVLIFDHGFQGFAIDLESLIICLFSGLATSFFVVSWTMCVRKNAYASLNVFLVLSTLIPIVLCRIIWNEEITLFKGIGFAILLVAVILMCMFNNKVKSKMTLKGLGLLILCAIFNGASSFAQKWRFFEVKETLSVYTFNFYTYLFSFIVLVITYLITRKVEKVEEKFEIKKVIGYVIVLSVCLFLNSLFYSLAAETLPSSILYPVSNGCALIIATLLGHFAYKEKINIYAIIGIVLALISFVFMIL